MAGKGSKRSKVDDVTESEEEQVAALSPAQERELARQLSGETAVLFRLLSSRQQAVDNRLQRIEDKQTTFETRLAALEEVGRDDQSVRSNSTGAAGSRVENPGGPSAARPTHPLRADYRDVVLGGFPRQDRTSLLRAARELMADFPGTLRQKLGEVGCEYQSSTVVTVEVLSPFKAGAVVSQFKDWKDADSDARAMYWMGQERTVQERRDSDRLKVLKSAAEAVAPSGHPAMRIRPWDGALTADGKDVAFLDTFGNLEVCSAVSQGLGIDARKLEEEYGKRIRRLRSCG